MIWPAAEQKSDRRIMPVSQAFSFRRFFMGRGILLWLLGIPIPIIILILLFVR